MLAPAWQSEEALGAVGAAPQTDVPSTPKRTVAPTALHAPAAADSIGAAAKLRPIPLLLPPAAMPWNARAGVRTNGPAAHDSVAAQQHDRLPAGPHAKAGAGRDARLPAASPALSPQSGLLRPQPVSQTRWSGSAWAFVRRGIGASLSPGGTLGGDQVGGRISYRLIDRAKPAVALSGRFYAPVDDVDAAEVAAGIEWQPIRRLPVRLLAERRQAVGSAGRSAFSLLAHGGVGDRIVADRIVVDFYAQVGIVGLRSHDLFADGSVRVGFAAGERLKVGGGAWGAAQPGATRVDVGPQATLRLPIGEAAVTLAADWRFRIAGHAAPGSGPALTLSTDF